MEARWHEDSDRWVWCVYDDKGTVTKGTGEDTSDIYIIPRSDGYWIVSGQSAMKRNKTDWIKELQDGGGVPVAGPFEKLSSAKAAWRLMYG